MSCETCGMAKDAAEKIKSEKKKNEIKKLLIICLTSFCSALAVSFYVFSFLSLKAQQETIIEQQYALNMQYASLIDYVSNADITTTDEAYADGDGSIAVSGNNNYTAGGDINDGE